MKNSIAMIVCVAAGLAAGRAGAQESDRGTTPPPAYHETATPDRADDLAAQAAEQERANAALRDQLRRADGAPGSLENDLVNTSADAAALRRKVAEQRIRRDAAADRYEAARREAMARLDDTDSMRAARRALDEAGAKLDQVSAPILERLADNEDYQELQALVDAAAQAGQALQGFDNVDPRTQAEADAAFDQATERSRAFEEAAIAADPRGAEAQRSFKSARAAIDDLRAENERHLANDVKVDGSRFALDLEERLLNDKAADLATAEKRLSAMRQAAGAARPNDIANPELANKLRDGEARLRDLNDRLEQARANRADDRERFADAGGRGELAPPPVDDGRYSEPPAYEPYPYREYSSYSYVPATTYYRYRSYYDYDPYAYCPPCYYAPYWGSSFSLGFAFGSSYCYRPFYHSYYRHYDFGGRDRFSAYGDFHAFRDDAWRHRYDSFRSNGRDGGFRDGRNSFAAGNSRYDYNRFGSSDFRHDRDARTSLDVARRGGIDADSRYRSGLNTHNSLASLRALDYAQDVRSRRAAADDVRRDYRSTGSTSSGGSSSPRWYDERSRSNATLHSERDASDDSRRREAADSAARHVRASESSASSSGRPRDSEIRSSHSSSDDSPRYVHGSSSSKDIGSSSSRSRSNDGPPVSGPPSRGSSHGSDGPPARSSGSSRGVERSVDAPSRSSGGGGGGSPSFGSSRSAPRGESSPSIGSGRGSSGGGSSSSGSSRGGGSSSSSGGGGGRHGR